LVGGLLGGLLGGPEVQKPRRAPEAQKTLLDPNRSAAIAAARKRQQEGAASQGRSDFRIDLNSGASTGGQTRSGIAIS
jgi:hypothetical protein